jgi:hypothetical protein
VADIAKAALRNRVLEHLGVLAAGETAATADSTYVDEVVDAAHDELRKLGLVPFPTSAIPSWAQIGLRNWVVAEVGQTYGKPWTDADVLQRKKRAEAQLARQVAGYKHNIPVRGRYF